MAEYLNVADRLAIVAELPRNPVGKVLKRELRLKVNS